MGLCRVMLTALKDNYRRDLAGWHFNGKEVSLTTSTWDWGQSPFKHNYSVHSDATLLPVAQCIDFSLLSNTDLLPFRGSQTIFKCICIHPLKKLTRLGIVSDYFDFRLYCVCEGYINLLSTFLEINCKQRGKHQRLWAVYDLFALASYCLFISRNSIQTKQIACSSLFVSVVFVFKYPSINCTDK